MSVTQTNFAGSIPENYERYLVPLIFDDSAADLVGRLAVPAGGHVLETACGTGAVTRHLRARLDASVEITATDLSPAMIEHAKAVVGPAVAPAVGPGVAFRQADATALPFADGAFDAVICQFGVMFYPDKAAGYREAARVLKPGGQFVFNVWDSLAHNGLTETVHAAVGGLFPDDPPRFLELPYGYHDLSGIKTELQRAGFAGIDIAVQPRRSEAPGSREVALAFTAGTPLASQLMERETASHAEIVDAVDEAIAGRYGSGPISAPMQAVQIAARLAPG
jgi:SAM-dependent methyltransferase